MTKKEILQSLSESTKLSQADLKKVFEELGDLAQRHIQKRGSGEFEIPNTGVKILRVETPARKARTGRNPQTGESIQIPAKKKGVGVKVKPMKLLKDFVQ